MLVGWGEGGEERRGEGERPPHKRPLVVVGNI